MDAQFQKMCEAYRAKLSGLDSHACRQRPRGDSAAWCRQDVVEHLVLTYRGTVEQTEKYRRRGTPTEKKPGLNQRVAKVAVLCFNYFPPNNQAPEFVRPGKTGLPEMDGNALARFLEEELSRLDAQLARCQEIFGEQGFAPHFRLGPLSAEQWRKFHCVHGWHHVKQLGRIEALTLASSSSGKS